MVCMPTYLQADSEMEGNRRIWGTNYSQSDMTAAIRRFLVTFHADSAEEAGQQQQQQDSQPLAAGQMATYVNLLRQVRVLHALLPLCSLLSGLLDALCQKAYPASMLYMASYRAFPPTSLSACYAFPPVCSHQPAAPGACAACLALLPSMLFCGTWHAGLLHMLFCILLCFLLCFLMHHNPLSYHFTSRTDSFWEKKQEHHYQSSILLVG